MYWYLKVMKNYFNFKGRARRKEYWMFTLVNTLIGFVFVIAMLAFINFPSLYFIIYLANQIYSFAVIIPSLAVTVRRLHDVGWSGWWLFVAIGPIIALLILALLDINFMEGTLFLFGISFICLIALFIATVMSGTSGDNKYGPDPKQEQVQIDS